MTAHFVVTKWNDQIGYEIQHFPVPEKDDMRKRDCSMKRILERHELTEAQAKLSIDELIVLLAAGKLKKYDPGKDQRDANAKAIEKAAKKETLT